MLFAASIAIDRDVRVEIGELLDTRIASSRFWLGFQVGFRDVNFLRGADGFGELLPRGFPRPRLVAEARDVLQAKTTECCPNFRVRRSGATSSRTETSVSRAHRILREENEKSSLVLRVEITRCRFEYLRVASRE